jgi:hypothetical protein
LLKKSKGDSFFFRPVLFGSLIGRDLFVRRLGVIMPGYFFGFGGLADVRQFWLGFCLILFRVLLKKSRGDSFSFLSLRVVWFSDWDGTSLVVSLGHPCLYFGFGGLT